MRRDSLEIVATEYSLDPATAKDSWDVAYDYWVLSQKSSDIASGNDCKCECPVKIR
jgi:hypothetical protein